jgi:hypothetical protein
MRNERRRKIFCLLSVSNQRGGVHMSFSDMVGVLTLIIGAATVLVAVAELFYAIGKDIGGKDIHKKR